MNYISKISASHYVLPKETLTNETLAGRFDAAQLERISKLSGIKERRIAPTGVTSADLGYEAAERLLKSENIGRSDFDMLIFVTQTPDYILPGNGFVVHQRLGLPATCGAFDSSMGCAAMPYGLSIADGLIASGRCKKILLIFADTVSKLIYPKDRSLMTLHGDGAAAFVIEKADGAYGFEFADIGTDSANWKQLIVPAGGARTPRSEDTKKENVDGAGICTTPESLQMNGLAVFHFAISTIPSAARASLEKHGLTLDDCRFVLLHQANKMMLEHIYNQLKVPKEKRFFFMENIGNLSGASTPVLLAEALRQGKFAEGGRALMAAFGVGLTWGIFSVNFAPNSVRASQASTEL